MRHLKACRVSLSKLVSYKNLQNLQAHCNDAIGVQQNMSSAFHPQSDDRTERVKRVLLLEDMLRHFVATMQDDWDLHLDALEFAYNNAWHQSIATSNSPFKFIYGQHPRSPTEAVMLPEG